MIAALYLLTGAALTAALLAYNEKRNGRPFPIDEAGWLKALVLIGAVLAWPIWVAWTIIRVVQMVREQR